MQLILGLQVGGLESMVQRLVTGLDRQRFESLVCCIDELGPLAEQLQQAGIVVHLLKRRPGTDWRYPRQLAKLLKAQRIDVLHLHNPTALFYGSLAGRLAGIRPIIYTEHGRDYSCGWKSRLINGLALRLVHHVVVLHERARDYAQRAERVPAARISKIYNGIQAPPAVQDARQRARKILALGANTPLIGIVARLDPIKNLPVLITAMQQVQQHCADARLLIIGDGPLRETLETQIAAERLQDAVHMLGTRSDVADILPALDLLVLPSISEGLSMTLIEGSAAGLPLVASDVGGNNELVIDGVNGLLVPAGEPLPLAQAMLTLLQDRAQARVMGDASRQRFRQHFDAATMIAGYQSLYSSAQPAGPR